MNEPNEDGLKAKVTEFFELLHAGNDPQFKAIAVAYFIKDDGARIAKKMRDWPPTEIISVVAVSNQRCINGVSFTNCHGGCALHGVASTG